MKDGIIQIGVLMGNIFTKHPMEVLRGLTVGATERGINLTVFPGAQGSIYDYWNTDDESASDSISFSEYNFQYNAMYDYANVGGFDAIIVTYGTLSMFLNDETKVQFFKKFGNIPLVIAQEYDANSPHCYLIVENYEGIHRVVSHLIEQHSYRRIVYLSGPKMNTEAMERLRGYRNAMASHGLHVSDSMIEYGDFSQDVEEQVIRLLENNPDAEAIACANDEMAMAAYRVCRARGKVIGRDIAITGFDDIEQAATFNPPLTTARQDGYMLGRMAIELAIARIQGEDNKGLHTFPAQLIVRGSCGCDFSAIDTSEGVLTLIDEFPSNYSSGDYISRMAETLAKESMMYMYSPAVIKACEEFLQQLSYILIGIMETESIVSLGSELRNSFMQLVRVKLDFSTRNFINWSILTKYVHRLFDALISASSSTYEKSTLIHSFMEKFDEHISSMLIQTGLEQKEIMEQSYIESAQVLARLKERVSDPTAFFKTCMLQVVAQGAKNAYLFLNELPIIHEKGTDFTCPERMNLIASSHGSEITIYQHDSGEVITKKRGFTGYYPGDKDHMYISFLLFSENEVYGLLLADITPEQLSAMHGVSMQIGNGLSFMSLSIKEEEAKKALNETLRELRERNKILASVSSNDPMTGVFNRRGFMEKALEINRLHDGEQAHLFFCDLDHLKEINDVFGHADGDYAITTLSQVLSDAMGDKGCCGRIGGDEFIAVLPCDEDGAKNVVATIKSALAKVNETSCKPYFIESSVGYASFICDEDVVFEDVIKSADGELYKDKQKRRASISRGGM